MWVSDPAASQGMITQPDSKILITSPGPNSLSKAFQPAVTVAHGLIDCTAVVVYLQRKLGVINELGINSSTILQ